MAKKDSFFIRAEVNLGHAAAFVSADIDLGSFVNLGQSKSTLLRVHGIQTQITDSSGLIPQMDGDQAGAIAWQLTTQSQTGHVRLSDKSVVASGNFACRNPDSSQEVPSQVYEFDIGPSNYINGYLVGVDTLYLAGSCDAHFATDCYVVIMMECTLEAATQSNATALALSQQ